MKKLPATLCTLHALMLAAPAVGQASFDLVLRDLSRVSARVIGVSESEVTWLDRGGVEVITPISELLGMEASAGAPAATGDERTLFDIFTYEPAVLRLVDGRRLTGAPVPGGLDPDALLWNHAVLGEVSVPLESIDRVALHRTTLGHASRELMPAADQNDIVRLRNGDRLEGFVVFIGADLTLEIDGREIVVPMESVDQLALANPRERWTGPMVWLADGSVLGASSITASGNTLRLVSESATPTEAGSSLALAASDVGIRLDDVDALAFDTRSLVPLASLIESEVADEHAPVFNAETLRMEGPTTIGVDLYPRSRWVSFEAVLPLRARAWGSCELVLKTDGVARARLPLSSESPVVSYTLDLDGASRLELVLEPGEFGRVQVEAEIRGAVIAVD